MKTIDVLNIDGSKKEEIELGDIFKISLNKDIIYQYVKWKRNIWRQGTSSTKTRGEVSGGGRKPWRQKGTGRARAGSNRSPIWRKGGVVFGPKPRDYSYNLPKKIRKKAFKMVLAEKIKNNEIVIIDNLEIEEPKTKKIVEIINNLPVKGRLLLVLENNGNVNVNKACANIPYLEAIDISNISAYKLLLNDSVIMTKGAFEKIKEKL